MMGHVALILFVLAFLQALLAACWAVAGWKLGLSRRAAMHWCASTLLATCGLALVLLRAALPDPLGHGLANAMNLGAVLLLIRGQQVFLRLRARDVEHGVLLAVVLGISLAWGGAATSAHGVLAVLVTACCMTWALLRSCISAYPAMKREFEPGLAFWLLAPQIAGAGLFAVRAVGGLMQPSVAAQPIDTDTPFNLAVLCLILALGLMAHGAMALMVLLRTVARLRKLSQRDALTGLLNRAEWTRQLEAQHRWLGRFGDPFALLVIDIDHFKRINDTLGHSAGDAALVSLAQLLQGSARQVDIIGRLGGEEFGVLLPRTDPMAALHTAERLRQTLAASEFQWRGHAVQLTVSIGVAIGSDADESPVELYERADQALYKAKHEGRNRTVVAGVPGWSVQEPADGGPDTAPGEGAGLTLGVQPGR